MHKADYDTLLVLCSSHVSEYVHNAKANFSDEWSTAKQIHEQQ